MAYHPIADILKRDDGKILYKGDPKSIAIPTTIQDVIMARVDRLPDPAKAVLQTGSVVEREFSHPLISKVAGLPEPALLTQNDHWKGNRLKALEGTIPMTMAEIFLNIDDRHASEAEHWIQKAVEADERNGMRFNLGRDYALYAEFFRRQGERAKARENLGKAIDILRQCGADGWVEKYEKELATLR